MTSEEMARSHLRLAQRILAEAERLHRDGAWNLVVRRCQESDQAARPTLQGFEGKEAL